VINDRILTSIGVSQYNTSPVGLRIYLAIIQFDVKTDRLRSHPWSGLTIKAIVGDRHIENRRYDAKKKRVA